MITNFKRFCQAIFPAYLNGNIHQKPVPTAGCAAIKAQTFYTVTLFRKRMP